MIEFHGTVLPLNESELIPPVGPPVQASFVTNLAQAYDASPFAAVQIGQTATSPDAVVLAHAVLTDTQRLAVVMTLPPDVVEPVGAARAVATLAALYPGRVQVRIPCTEGHEAQHAEFARLVSALWQVRRPLDFAGRYYTLHRQWSVLRPDPVPVVVSHAGAQAFDPGVPEFADVCVLPADPPPEVAARVARLRELAGDLPLRFGIAIRPILATEATSANGLARSVLRVAPLAGADDETDGLRNEETHVLAALTGACGSTAPFVGDVATTAARLVEYWAAGIDVFHLRGFDPVPDVALHGAVISEVLERTAPANLQEVRADVA